MKLIDKKDKYLDHKNYYVLGPSVVYCPNSDDMLLNADLFDNSDSNTGSMLWRSLDKGLTWQEEDLIEKSHVYDFKNSKVKNGYGALYTDHKAKVIMYFANETYWVENKLDSVWFMRKLYYRLSFDQGHTWTDKKYVIQKGDKYNSIDFLRDGSFGKNMVASVSPYIVRTLDDSLLISVQVQMLNEDGSLYNPTTMGYMKAGALRASWNKDKLEYDFEIDSYVTVDPKFSTRGLYEPAFGYIDNNNLIMLMRNSNYTKDKDILGVKYFSISKDQGKNWTKPEMLKYDDDKLVYSSSCIPKLLNHSNGNLYFIGVINEDNPKGNLPRYPLVIAQVDKKTCRIIKDKMLVIDDKRENHIIKEGIKNVVDYSNHGIYEDKFTKRIIVLAPYREDLSNYKSYLNRYEIEV